jgi:hypothetical protein
MTPIPSLPALPPSLPSPSPSLLLILLTPHPPPPTPWQVQTTTTKPTTHNTPNIPPKTLRKNSRKILFATTKNLRSNFPTITDRFRERKMIETSNSRETLARQTRRKEWRAPNPRINGTLAQRMTSSL